MSPVLLFCILIAYFALLLGVAWLTSRNADNDSFFIGNKSSNWMLVAFGMVGTTLSGVTFISVPGAVGKDGFGYLQVLIGYVLGYIAVVYVLLPLYYRLKLTSIYHYLDVRLGRRAYQSGAGFFILSRLFGATARLYLVVAVLQGIILDSLGVPFWLTTFVILGMILLYTYQGGVKTIVWTDTLQTTCMLFGLFACAWFMLGELGLSVPQALGRMQDSGLARVFTTDIDSPRFLAQADRRRRLHHHHDDRPGPGNDAEDDLGEDPGRLAEEPAEPDCRAGRRAVVLPVPRRPAVPVRAAGRRRCRRRQDLPGRGDGALARGNADHLPDRADLGPVPQRRRRDHGADLDLLHRHPRHQAPRRHVGGGQGQAAPPRAPGLRLLFLVMVMVFKWLDDPSMIGVVLKVAGYTYGPLLGLFAFGMMTRRTLNDRLVPFVTIGAPILCAMLEHYQQYLLGSYRLGLELLIVNGLLVFAGLFAISRRPRPARLLLLLELDVKSVGVRAHP
jgi:hypothetical protein